MSEEEIKKPKFIEMRDSDWKLLINYFKEKGYQPKVKIAEILEIKVEKIRKELEEFESKITPIKE